jgi:TolA-binding protein
MHNLVQIENDKELARDISSHAVISMSSEKADSYRARRRVAEQHAMEVNRQQEEIDNLKDDIKEIKTMLQALLQR